MSRPADKLFAVYPGLSLQGIDAELLGCLPRAKDDMVAAGRLPSLDPADGAPIIPHLLTWLQDFNWPVSRPIARWIVRAGALALPALRQVLESDDDVWKYWVLDCVVRNLPRELVSQLRPVLEQVGEGGDPEEAHVVAREILDQR